MRTVLFWIFSSSGFLFMVAFFLFVWHMNFCLLLFIVFLVGPGWLVHSQYGRGRLCWPYYRNWHAAAGMVNKTKGFDFLSDLVWCHPIVYLQSLVLHVSLPEISWFTFGWLFCLFKSLLHSPLDFGNGQLWSAHVYWLSCPLFSLLIIFVHNKKTWGSIVTNL